MAINEQQIVDEAIPSTLHKVSMSDVLGKSEAAQLQASKPRAGGVSAPYVEVPIRTKAGVDVLRQMNANVQQLEDLCGRLNFMMSELQGLLKR